MRQVFFLVVSLLCVVQLNAQSYPFKTLKFNVPIGSTMPHSSGLEVKGVLTNSRLETVRLATLEGAPERCRTTRLFTLFITVTNKGKDSILISDWHFQACCPENVHGQQWDEKSYIKLVTPYIPSDINILLKPNEKKSFYTSETDFYWCLSAHEEALKTRPCTFTALITCAQLGPYNSGIPVGFWKNNCQPKITVTRLSHVLR